ncbi:XkdX family protein [Limosilactobacillus fermentum]|uniref:XkdX family protein n=1 Tax=Limosilactobacillus fermentum TaxID=1613 RepID=UPI003DA1F8AE
MFDLVKQSYQAGWYTIDNVKTFVIANMITKDEYKQIIGQDYDAVTTPQSA